MCPTSLHRTLLDRLLLMLPVVLAGAFAFEGFHAPDTDMFQHLASGRWMLDAREVIDSEVFSYTVPGREWVNYSWLFQILLSVAYEWIGLRGLVILRAVMVLVTAGLLVMRLRQSAAGGAILTAAIGGLAMALYLPRALSVRPHLFSYVFLALLPMLLDRFEQRRRFAGLSIVLLCVLWANLHGVEYPVALAAVATLGSVSSPQAGGRRRHLPRRLVLVAACGLAFLANPFGARLFLAPAIALDPEILNHIPEMQRYEVRSLFALIPAAHFFTMVPFNLLLAGAAVGLTGTRDWKHLLALAWPAALVFFRIRFVAEFALISAPAIAFGLSRVAPKVALVGRVTAAVAVAYLVGAGGMTLVSHVREGRYELLDKRRYPAGAVQFLRDAGVRGNVLCSPTVAGYVEWTLAPDVKVAMDMRAPAPFDATVAAEVTSIRTEKELIAFADKYGVGWTVLSKRSRLAKALASAASPRLRLLYDDGADVVYGYFAR